MIHEQDALDRAVVRIQDNSPQLREGIARWFKTNAGLLQPLAKALIRQTERSGTGIDATTVVDQLLAKIQANPQLYEWAYKFRDLLRIVVEAVVEGLQDKQVPTAALPMFTRIMPRTVGERLTANAAAINLAASHPAGGRLTGEQRLILQRYTGNGGISLDRLAELVPAEWLPTRKAMLDEFFTPHEICEEIARIALYLAGNRLEGIALEPACGVGRFVGAFAPIHGLAWTCIEISKISATIATLLYPKARVYNQPFEQFIADNHDEYAGKVALVVTNPPYGARGANKTLDPDKSYRREIAYQYVVERSFDLLQRGGIGVAIVPNSFLSGQTADTQKARERVLRRHHLLCAYRLPSNIYPGAAIVTDVSYWWARGGELASVEESDRDILAGKYFEQNPQMVLGELTTSGRGRLEVLGDFQRLPEPIVRPFCEPCAVTPFRQTLVRKRPPEELLNEDQFIAHQLGRRVLAYLAQVASQQPANLAIAAAAHSELVDALQSWVASQRLLVGSSYVPTQDKGLVAAAKQLTTVAAVLSVFDSTGSLLPQVRDKPNYVESYAGPATAAAQAEWLYEKQRRLTIADLIAFRESLGFEDTEQELVDTLVSQGWCEDWIDGDLAVWLPEQVYYTGDLWPRLDSARKSGSPQARVQVQRLLLTIGSVSIDEAAPALREAWVPTDVVAAFLTAYLKLEVPRLEWQGALLKPFGLPYSKIDDLNVVVQIALGYCNHDLSYFAPPYNKSTDPTTGEQETAEAALDRERIAYGTRITKAFGEWLGEHLEYHSAIVEAFQRRFRGYIVPTYHPEPLKIARWGRNIVPKPHQLSGAWRLIRNNGGLLAYDVGVGKTLTGIATVAYLRQIGRARRPLVVVPNSIIWKWHREITRALPDYRVAVIGSVRYIGRNGLYRSRLDDAVERQRKLTLFQLGQYDIAIVTYSAFGTTRLSEQSIRSYVEDTPALMRSLGLRAAKTEEEISNLDKLEKTRDRLRKRVAALAEKLAGQSIGDDGGDDDDDEDNDIGEE